MISQLEEPKLFTMVLAVIDPVDGPARMTVCLAGHPRPVKVCVDGSCESAGKRGMLLGVLEEPTLHNSVVTLAPGESIVFYTDGALGKYDAEDPLDFGGRLERLRGFDAATIADEVVARARASSAHDDVAVLVIRSLH
jgi:serine phosphatase RsbU (regulator of sigma subunit)